MVNVFFVYGTLKSSESRGKLFEKWMQKDQYKVVSAKIKADLYDLGAFPGIIEGKGTVYGEAIILNEKRLIPDLIKTLDMIEGYSGRHDHPGNLYVREVVDVELEDGTITEGITYFFANAPLLVIQASKISSGVWKSGQFVPPW